VPQTLPLLKKLVGAGRQRGISFAVRGNLIVISPPLVIAQEDLAHGLDVMEEYFRPCQPEPAQR